VERVREYLARQPFFSSLTHAELENVASVALLRTRMRGEIIGLEGDPCTEACFVVEGRVQVIKISAQGREQIIAELEEGQSVYLVPALDGGPLPAITQAATRVTLLCIPRQHLLGLLQRYPALAMQALGEFARRLRRLTSLVEDLALRSVPQRLARMLLERAESPVTHRTTQREMASQLGTVREVLARALADLERQGCIGVQRGVIEILDADALRDLVEM
jgi:CRP-like cAMP-binding protein